MKNLIGVMFVVIILTGCQQMVNEAYDTNYSDRYCGFNLYYGDFSSIQNEKDIPLWINSHIRYLASDNIQSLYECVVSGHGDCEEKALMYLNIMYIVFHKKGELCLVDTSARTIEFGGEDINHAVVRYNGVIIEPATGRSVYYTVCYSYAFNHIFR